jgi:hypothetical protein
MKFARIVFFVAGIWGVLVITPLFFMFDLIGRQDPPPITHPGFYYGFVTTALAWQIAFFFIARDPLRHRLLMLPSIFEKFAYVIAMTALYTQHRIRPSDLVFDTVDLLFGILFVISFVKTRPLQSR